MALNASGVISTKLAVILPALKTAVPINVAPSNRLTVSPAMAFVPVMVTRTVGVVSSVVPPLVVSVCAVPKLSTTWVMVGAVGALVSTL